MLEVRSHSQKGRGVFAVSRLVSGEIIETAPIILIPASEWPHIEPTVLALYIYNFGPTADEEHAAIALGYGSLYNHSYTPNAKYTKNWDEQVICFVAVRDIEPGEEITINYNGSPENQTPIWFETSE
jgi:SET domain-containing protein